MHVVKGCLIRILECYWADKSFVYKASGDANIETIEGQVSQQV